MTIRLIATCALVLSILPASVHAQNLPTNHTDVATGEESRRFNLYLGNLAAPGVATRGWDSVIAQPTTLIEWQRQYDEAIRRRNSGSAKVKASHFLVLGGLALFAAGAANYEEDSSRGSQASGLVAAGLASFLVGNVAYFWGGSQRNGAREDMETLERLRSSVKSPSSLQLSGASGGRRMSLGYRITW